LFIVIALTLCACFRPQVVHHTTNDFIYGGYPKVSGVKILKNLGYEVGYSQERKNPLWTAYKVPGESTLTDKGSAPNRYMTDPRLTQKTGKRWIVQHDNFTNTGYDRGHMAPAHAIGTRYGRAAYRQTYLLSNICPQRPTLNRGLWRIIEEAVANGGINKSEAVWVITGPVFDNDRTYINNKIEIPDYFYKIIISENGKVIRTLSFMLPQEIGKGENLAKYIVSIDKIEEATGIDFLSKLDDELEDALESAVATKLWNKKK
jgi:endonuclease G